MTTQRQCAYCGQTLVRRQNEDNWRFLHRITCGNKCARPMVGKGLNPKSHQRVPQAPKRAASVRPAKRHKPPGPRLRRSLRRIRDDHPELAQAIYEYLIGEDT